MALKPKTVVMALKPKTVKQAPAKAAVSAFTMPASIGGVVDALYTTRNERLAMGKLVAELEEREKLLQAWIIDNLPKSDQTQGAGKLARASIVRSTIPAIEDWAKFYAHVKRTGSFELLQKRLGEAAIKERWDAGKDVPGVGTFNIIKVSVNKL